MRNIDYRLSVPCRSSASNRLRNSGSSQNKSVSLKEQWASPRVLAVTATVSSKLQPPKVEVIYENVLESAQGLLQGSKQCLQLQPPKVQVLCETILESQGRLQGDRYDSLVTKRKRHATS